jgi:protein LTV1
MQIEAERRDASDYESTEEEDDEEEKWDAETILTTYTNTDNHPSVIKFVPKIKVNHKMKIELHT